MPVKTKSLPPLELLNSILEVDDLSPTGLRWKASRTNRVKIGDPAGTKHNQGYWQVAITTDKKRLYLCHRIVYYMKTGIDPVNNFIDHTTNERDNNSQIRLCLFKDNTRNRKKNKSESQTSSSFKGVSWDNRNKKWKAQICVDYKATNLGRFLTEKEAAQAYNEAAIKFFGEYAWLNKVT